MGLTVTLTPRAIADLDEVRSYLSVRDAAAADRVPAHLDQAINALAEFPGLGRALTFALPSERLKLGTSEGTHSSVTGPRVNGKISRVLTSGLLPRLA